MIRVAAKGDAFVKAFASGKVRALTAAVVLSVLLLASAV
jgi:hypothetical protein